MNEDEIKKQEASKKLLNALENSENYYLLVNPLGIDSEKISMRAIEVFAHHKITSKSDIMGFYKALSQITDSLAEKYKQMTGQSIDEIKCNCPACTGDFSNIDPVLNKMVKAISSGENPQSALEMIHRIVKMDEDQKELLLRDVEKATSLEEVRSLLKGC